MSDLANRNAVAMRAALEGYQEELRKAQSQVHAMHTQIAQLRLEMSQMKTQVALLLARTQ